MSNYDKIVRYLSSSELNRLHKNGVSINIHLTPSEWILIFNSSWMPRKLRRKLYTLYNLGLLPILVAPVIGMTYNNQEWFKELGRAMMSQYLKAEDEAIMKGAIK